MDVLIEHHESDFSGALFVGHPALAGTRTC
jgi:hypothetical protein